MTFQERLANMQNAGGNHPAQNIQGIIQEGRKSYQHTIDSKLGTNKAENAFTKEVKQITPPPRQNNTPKR